ncbi:MAG: 23S rRNA (guanosine(2251)-2'-O)-methyltransferase RlmB [Coriobacteriia bacterium]
MASEFIEGRNAVSEALRARVPLEKIMIADGATGTPIDQVERLASRASVPVERVGRKKLDSMSERGAHQGVIAVASPFAFTPLDEVIRRVGDRNSALVVVLDHIHDPGNLGAVIRSVDVAGGDAVVVPKRRTAPVGAAAYKSSAGAIAHVPIVQEANIVQCLERLKGAGFWVAGADATASVLAWDAPLEGRLVLVLGSEGDGLSRLVREKCDFLVGLPVAGHVDSLNVAQAATVLAFEWVRRSAPGGDA